MPREKRKSASDAKLRRYEILEKERVEQRQKEIEQAWRDVLAHVYAAVNWKKIARGRSAHDIFEHRLEFARYEQSVPSLLQKLLNRLSLQAPPMPLDKIEFLRRHEFEALQILRSMPKLLTLYAAEDSKEL